MNHQHVVRLQRIKRDRRYRNEQMILVKFCCLLNCANRMAYKMVSTFKFSHSSPTIAQLKEFETHFFSLISFHYICHKISTHMKSVCMAFLFLFFSNCCVSCGYCTVRLAFTIILHILIWVLHEIYALFFSLHRIVVLQKKKGNTNHLNIMRKPPKTLTK